MNVNKLGLPTNGADPDTLFNTDKEVETPASEEKVTETATSPDVVVETKEETPVEEIPVEPTNEEKLELGRVEFIKFLGSRNPEDAAKLANQDATGKAGYQQALAYAKVGNPEVVEQWRNDGMLQKTAQTQPPVVVVPEQPVEIDEFDPYNKSHMMNLMTTAIQTEKQQDIKTYNHHQQQTLQEQIRAEGADVYAQFNLVETNIKAQLGDELGSKIIADAFTKVNSYGIDTNRVGGAINFANAFNDQLSTSLNRHNAEVNKGVVETKQQAKISADLKKTMLQSQPAGSASDATTQTPKQKHLAKLQSRKETSVSSSLKTLNE